MFSKNEFQLTNFLTWIIEKKITKKETPVENSVTEK